MINFIKQKNDMKKLAYIVITSSMFLTTSCVDLTQEPQSFITEEEYIAAVELFKAYRLPVNLDGINDLDIDKIIAITKSDKKADNNCIKFVLVNGIGNAFTDKTVTDEEMKEALKMITGGQNE